MEDMTLDRYIELLEELKDKYGGDTPVVTDYDSTGDFPAEEPYYNKHYKNIRIFIS